MPGGGCLLPGVPGPGRGVCSRVGGAWWRPPGWPLLRVVHIPLRAVTIENLVSLRLSTAQTLPCRLI